MVKERSYFWGLGGRERMMLEGKGQETDDDESVGVRERGSHSTSLLIHRSRFSPASSLARCREKWISLGVGVHHARSANRRISRHDWYFHGEVVHDGEQGRHGQTTGNSGEGEGLNQSMVGKMPRAE
jgi:hypothetical protein